MAPRTYFAKSRGQGRSADVSIAYQVYGAGLDFEDRGQHELKGIPGKWHLFAAPTRP